MGRARALVAGTVFLLVGLGAHRLVDGAERRVAIGAGTGTPAAPPAPAGTTPRRPVRALGDRTPVGGAVVTLRAVVDPFEGTDLVVTAPAGRRWVAADIEVTNLSTEVRVMDGDRQFTVRDVTDRRFEVVVTAEVLPPLDGPLAPGATRRGTLVFEVPEAARDLRLAFSGGGHPLLIALG